MAMFPGKTFNISGQDYVVPALTVGILRKGGRDLIRQHDEMVNKEDVGIFDMMDMKAKVVFLALQRNYPDMTEDQFADIIDVEILPEIWWSVLGLSNLLPKDGGDAGEQKAAT
jgi:hypothetical protein